MYTSIEFSNLANGKEKLKFRKPKAYDPHLKGPFSEQGLATLAGGKSCGLDNMQ